MLVIELKITVNDEVVADINQTQETNVAVVDPASELEPSAVFTDVEDEDTTPLANVPPLPDVKFPFADLENRLVTTGDLKHQLELLQNCLGVNDAQLSRLIAASDTCVYVWKRKEPGLANLQESSYKKLKAWQRPAITWAQWHPKRNLLDYKHLKDTEDMSLERYLEGNTKGSDLPVVDICNWMRDIQCG